MSPISNIISPYKIKKLGLKYLGLRLRKIKI